MAAVCEALDKMAGVTPAYHSPICCDCRHPRCVWDRLSDAAHVRDVTIQMSYR